MKKLMAALLATSMMLGIGATAFAAPVNGEDNKLKDTVVGFAGGSKTAEQDLRGTEGSVSLSFDLGANANYYTVDVAVREGGKYVAAEYSKGKKSVVLRPTIKEDVMEEKEYEVEIEVLDRNTKDVVAKDFSITGTVSYDKIQQVEDGGRYVNTKGAFYDFGEGARDVDIYVGRDMHLKFDKTVKGSYNLRLSDEGNKSIDYMFSKHELTYYTFPSAPKFSNSVEVTLGADSGSYLYQYAGGKLTKVPGAEYDEDAGAYTFSTNQLAMFILADMPLQEGVVSEDQNLIKPGSGSSNGSSGGSSKPNAPSGDKNNPTTGAPDLMGLAVPAGMISLGALAVKKLSK